MIETYLKEVELNGQKIYKTFAILSSIKKDPNNPKEIDPQKQKDLDEFLARYDQLQPLLVDARPEKEGQLLGGNHTLESLIRIGRTDGWIEFRTPMDDADAFIIATLHNQQFANYVEGRLKNEIKKYETQLIDDIKKLEAQIKTADSFDTLLKEKPSKPFKFEIVIKCDNEQDLNDKVMKLSELGIAGKKRGK